MWSILPAVNTKSTLRQHLIQKKKLKLRFYTFLYLRNPIFQKNKMFKTDLITSSILPLYLIFENSSQFPRELPEDTNVKSIFSILLLQFLMNTKKTNELTPFL